MKYFKRLELQVFYRVVIISTSQAFQAQHVPLRPSDFLSTLLALQQHTDRSSTLHSFCVKSSGTEAFNSNGKISLKQEILPSNWGRVFLLCN